VPAVALTLSGSVINPAFAAGIGWPPLAEGNGPVMIALALAATFVTAWEIFDAFRHALRARGGRPALGLGQTLI
jgi:hypothetical protein